MRSIFYYPCRVETILHAPSYSTNASTRDPARFRPFYAFYPTWPHHAQRITCLSISFRSKSFLLCTRLGSLFTMRTLSLLYSCCTLHYALFILIYFHASLQTTPVRLVLRACFTHTQANTIHSFASTTWPLLPITR